MVNDKKSKREGKRKRGGWRPRAGRKPSQVVRRHKTFWVSDEEEKKIKEFLFRNRSNDPEDVETN